MSDYTTDDPTTPTFNEPNEVTVGGETTQQTTATATSRGGQAALFNKARQDAFRILKEKYPEEYQKAYDAAKIKLGLQPSRERLEQRANAYEAQIRELNEKLARTNSALGESVA